MSYGMFSGCSCCGEINICVPKQIPGGIGDVTINGWGFASLDATDREAPGAKWYAILVVNTTHAGSFTFVFEQAYTRTFHIPTVDGRSPDFWEEDKIYFSTPVTVTFTSSDLTVYVGEYSSLTGVSALDELVEDSAEDEAFREAFNDLNPFEVGLTVFPISSVIPPDVPGEVEYPNAFSDHYGIPPIDGNATDILDHIESSWANLVWFNSGSWDPDYFVNWGHGSEGFVLNDPAFFHSYTDHPRGFTFLPNGLGVLDEPINEFGSQGFPGFPAHAEQNFSWAGGCYLNRLNAFIAPLAIVISGIDLDDALIPDDPGNADVREILLGMNGFYNSEWSDTDRFIWFGRNDYWCIQGHLFTYGLTGFKTEVIDNQLAIYDTDSGGSSTFQLGMEIYTQVLFGHYTDSYVGFNWLNGETTLSFDQVKLLPGVGSYEVGDDTILYFTDPAAYMDAIASLLEWEKAIDYGGDVFLWDDLVVSISSA